MMRKKMNSGDLKCLGKWWDKVDACRQQGSTSRVRENPVFLCCPPSCPQVLCVGDGSKKVSEDGEFGMWKVDVTQGE